MSLADSFRNCKAGAARYLDIARAAYTDQKQQEPLTLPKGQELEFLPAALEVQATPASPAGRAVIWSIIAVFSLFIIWSIFGHIDIIAVAQGKIIPSDYSKVIQPLETGVVKAIHVRDGQRVKKGELLVEIDATASADRERYVNEYTAALTDVARLRALIAGKSTFEAPEGADPAYIRNQHDRLRDQLAQYRALNDQAKAFRELQAKQYVSRMQYLEAERARADKAQEFAAALSEAETRAHSLSRESAKAHTRAAAENLTAPIDGVVQQLAVHTIGGVVTPAQQLMVIAPQESHLEVEAWIENKDIGFVSAGQEAEIKIEAFPFTRYGVIEGRVSSLSGDAVPIEKVGLVYTGRVAMAKGNIEVENGRQVRLSPGMNVTVEIKTGQRRLIEYFLSPLLRGVKEAARER